jgi:hypothetical protein
MMRNWATVFDTEIFAEEVVVWPGEAEAFRKEREKRINQKRAEQERIEREPLSAPQLLRKLSPIPTRWPKKSAPEFRRESY